MKKTLICVALVAASGQAAAVAVDFNVPLELRNITTAATHAMVTCGSWDDSPGSRRFLSSETVSVPLGAGDKQKSYVGVVRVRLAFPGDTVPKGKYRCTVGMRTADGPAELTSQPAAAGTRSIVEVVGDFAELNTQATVRPGTLLAPTKPLAPVPSK